MPEVFCQLVEITGKRLSFFSGTLHQDRGRLRFTNLAGRTLIFSDFIGNEVLHGISEAEGEEAVAEAFTRCQCFSVVVQGPQALHDLLEKVLRLLLGDSQPGNLSFISRIVDNLELVRWLRMRLEPTCVHLVEALVLQRNRIHYLLNVKVEEHVEEELMHYGEGSREFGHCRPHCFCAALLFRR